MSRRELFPRLGWEGKQGSFSKNWKPAKIGDRDSKKLKLPLDVTRIADKSNRIALDVLLGPRCDDVDPMTLGVYSSEQC